MLFLWCVCGVNDKITLFHHQDSLMQFLIGLNEVYSQVRTQILMMEPSPSIDKAFSLVIHEERQRALGFNGGPLVDATALAVKTQGFNQGGKNTEGKGRPICSHCGKARHFMEKCYKLIGFPPGYKQKGKVSMANQVCLNGDSGQSENASQPGSFPFTSKQCQQLLSLLISHASSSATPNAIHSTNSALSGIFCVSFQDSTCLSLNNSIFTENQLTMKKLRFLTQGLLTTLFIPFPCLLRSLIQYLLLCIYLMVKKSLPHT